MLMVLLIVVVALCAGFALFAAVHGAVPGYQDEWGFHAGAEPRPQDGLYLAQMEKGRGVGAAVREKQKSARGQREKVAEGRTPAACHPQR